MMWFAVIYRATIHSKTALHFDVKMSGTQTCIVRFATNVIWDCEENRRDSTLDAKTPDVNRALENQI